MSEFSIGFIIGFLNAVSLTMIGYIVSRFMKSVKERKKI